MIASRTALNDRRCKRCGAWFQWTKSRRKYCSDACRTNGMQAIKNAYQRDRYATVAAAARPAVDDDLSADEIERRLDLLAKRRRARQQP